LAADSRFLPAYEQMALIAANHKQWKDLADLSDRMLRLNPINFPKYWFLNAVANYQLQNLDVAQKSAVRGIEVDVQHQFPRLEYILGLVLTQKRDYHGALEHMRNYVRLSPKAPDVATAQNTISQLESLEAASGRSPESK
jgi:tetratricopeptide (TPR) repeat protein